MTRKWQQLMNQGAGAMERHNFGVAAEKFLAALSLAEKSCDAMDRFETLTALGAAYAANNHSELAEQVYSRALSLCALSDQLGNYPVAGCLLSLANVYRDLGRPNDSRASALKSIELLTDDTTGEPTIILIPLTLLIELSIKDSNFEVASYYLDKAIKVFNQHCSHNSASFKDKLAKQIEQMPATMRDTFKLRLPTSSSLVLE